MVSICFCFIEFLCGLVMARSVCNQSHVFFCSPPPFFLFSFSLLRELSADSVFVSFLSSLSLFFSVGITYKRLWKNDMCRADSVSFSPLTPLVTYQRKLTHLPEKRGRKNLCLKEKKNPNLELVYTHPCVIIYFQCRVPGISALEWGVETESFPAFRWGQVLFGKKEKLRFMCDWERFQME